MTFKKGYDPRRNVGRNSRKTADGKTLPDLARTHTEDALNFVVATLNDPQADPWLRMRAAETLFNRGWGMARQVVDVSKTVQHEHQLTIDVTKLSKEARLQILEAQQVNVEIIDVPVIEHQPEALKSSNNENGQPE